MTAKATSRFFYTVSPAAMLKNSGAYGMPAIVIMITAIVLPLLSAGNYEYPRDKALMVASQAISAFLMKNDMDVYIVFYDSESVATGKKLSDFGENIDDEYVEGKDEGYVRRSRIAVDHWKAGMAWQKSLDMSELETDADMSEKMVAKDNLEKLLKAVEDPFSVKLKQYVEKSGKKKKDIFLIKVKK